MVVYGMVRVCLKVRETQRACRDTKCPFIWSVYPEPPLINQIAFHISVLSDVLLCEMGKGFV